MNSQTPQHHDVARAQNATVADRTCLGLRELYSARCDNAQSWAIATARVISGMLGWPSSARGVNGSYVTVEVVELGTGRCAGVGSSRAHEDRPFNPRFEHPVLEVGGSRGSVLLRVHVGIDGDVGRVLQQATNDPALRMLATVAIEVFESTVWKLECHRRRIAARLTSAQRRVLEYMVQGHSERTIGELLERSPHTVHDHICAIYRTLEIASRSELLLLWNAPDTAPRATDTPVGAGA